ncbi:hypothetical protein LUZ60_005353 [Juncus effusus]|nr:hypothetical protein LUZ60_005353 [Juncus effusus]
MAALSHSESRRLYSWWWDSHIRTKNSKWLKENLTDMDGKIKSMIKIIEEDADSFAKRAEMYYRRRPELMTLVEEIYRAYRALAERYDHATGALRQAHRTMAQAFPDLNLEDDDDDDDEDDDYEGLKGGGADCHQDDLLPPLADLQKRIQEYEALRKEISRLSQENEDLKTRIAANSESEFETSSLKETISKLETEKEAALLQSKESSERLTNLTAQISHTQQEFDKLKEEMQFRVQGLSSTQQRCDELERTTKNLVSELERAKQRAREKEEEAEKLNISLQSEQIQKMQSEMNRMAFEKKLKESYEKLRAGGKMEKEIERIREEKRKLEGQNRVSNSVINRLEGEMKKGADRLAELERKNQGLSSELERMKQRKRESEEELKKRGERFVELERMNQGLIAELERMKERKRECEDELKKGGERNQSLSFELERMKQKQRECDEELKKGGERNQSLCFELERMKERQRESEEELRVELERLNVSLQETQLQKMKAEMGKMSLEKALDESEERIRVLSEERERLEGEGERKNLSLMLEVERMKQRQRENEEELSKQKEKFERLDVYLHEVQLKKVETEKAKVELEREMERIKGENSTLCLNLKERETELSEKRAELERFNASLQDAQVRAEMERIELEREMERMKEEHTNLCSNLKERERKLSEKIGKLEKISVNLQEAHLEKMHAQISHLSIEKKLVELQERSNLLSLQKEKLEREIESIREENKKLDEQNHSANSRIILLQDEVISLKDLKRKLEDQVSVYAEEKRIAQEELSRIKGDKTDLEWRHFSLTEQIQTVNLNVESLQGLVKELKDGNFELKEIIKNHEDVKILQTENFKQLNRVSDKNSDLEKSLWAANAELEGLRKEKNELEISSENLYSKLYEHQAERAVMVSQIEAMSENIEKLVGKKILLENSLFDANAEIEGLREKLRELDEFCRSLRGQNEKLTTDKRSLLYEVQNVSNILSNLEMRYKELELNHSNLHKEKAQILNQITNFQNMLSQERNTHLETLNLLKSESRSTKEQLESEQKRVVNAQNEIFKLERSLNEANEKISNLNSIQKEKERLARGIISIKECLKLDKKYDSLHNMKDEIIVQLILHEIKLLLNSISESQDARQSQVVEKSLVVTLLEHFGKEVSELRLERSDMKQENEMKSKELQELKGELEFILGQVSDLQDSRWALQKEIVNLFEENSSLSNELKEKEGSETELNMILTELMSKEILGVVFETLFEEKVEENERLRNEITDLRNRESDLASCDNEIEKLLGNMKRAIFNAALFKEKVLDLMITCESFEIGEMAQREVLKEDLSGRTSYVDELKEKLSKIEVENRRLKVDLNGEFTILNTLQDEVRALEEQTLSLAKRSNKHKKEEKKASPSKHSRTRLKPAKEENDQTLSPNPNSELRKLQSTIKSLQEVVRDTALVLDQEHLGFASTLSNAKKQVEILKLREISDDDVAQVNQVNQKDIQLDLVQHSNSSSSSSQNSRGERDRVLRRERERQKNIMRASWASGTSEETWGFVEGGERESSSERKKQNVRSLMMHDIELEYPEIELLERERDNKGKRPSTDQMSEKELGVDNQAVPITESGTDDLYREWRKTVLERLTSDSQRLIVLQAGLNEIKSNIESSEGGSSNFSSQEMEGVKLQIREAEGTISQLIETNNKLLKKVDDLMNNSEGENNGDLITKSQRKIMDRAMKVSEKIGRLEVELEKVQNLILKLEEENSSRNTRNGQRRSKVLLVEYLYGRKKDSKKQRKGPPCGCMRVKTQE